MKRIALLAVFGLFLCTPAFGSATGVSKVLLDGVRTIGKPGIPGPIAVTGERAFAVALGRTQGGVNHAVVAAAESGKGRVVAFGHGGYLTKGTLSKGDTARLVVNAFRWVSAGKEKARVGLVGSPALRPLLQKSGFAVSTVPGSRWKELLGELDVLCITHPDLFGVDEKALAEFVARGGGLVTAGLAWGWLQLNPGRELTRDHRLNRLLAPMGLCFTDGFLNTILPTKGDGVALDAAHAGTALAALEGKTTAQAVAMVVNAYRWLPAGETAYRNRVRKIVAKAGLLVPTKRRPIRAGDAVSRLAITVRHVDATQAKPEEVAADPAASDFPGAVPEEAARVTRDLEIDGPEGWASTGLYAPAGEVLTVELLGEKRPTGLRVRIGCHTDRLWGKERWMRAPQISMSRALATKKTRIASPYGGAVYIEVPRGAAGPFRVRIRGAVEAPWFVLGKTDPKEWKEKIRHHPAPWAELGNGKIILSVRSEDVRDIDDPTELMTFWDNVLDLYAELGERPLSRRPQRMVPDRQISAGYMHSGYPIMLQIEHSELLVSLARMRDVPKEKGAAWGLWHELGHNHQQRDWTFSGTTEVTCNLFSLFVGDKVRGIDPSSNPWPRGKWKKVVDHVTGDRSFARWKKDPGLALWMYILLQQEFGWEAYRKVFKEYAGLPAAERPRNDQDKQDQWMVRFSKAVDHDLGPYFEVWGVPVTAAARKRVAELKPWMPKRLADLLE